MDHRQALRTQAAERYLLGELTAVEAEEFELHYFECPQCALAVESGQMFIAGVQGGAEPEIAPAPATRPRGSSLGEWLAGLWRQPALGYALAAVAVGVALYQGAVVIPGLSRHRPLAAFHLVGAARAEDQKIAVAKGDPFVEFNFDIPVGEEARMYSCVITTGGRALPAFDCPQAAEGRPVTIQVPIAELRPGKGQLELHAETASGRLIQTYPFDFRNQ